MRDIFNRMQVPYVCLIGNHDCLGTGESVFKTIYGDLNFSFTAGNVHFICLNTNALEYDYANPVPDFEFMRNQHLNFPAQATKTIFAMHVRPTDEQFNNNVAYIFDSYTNTFPNLQFSICGHGHNLIIEDIFNSGNTYYECPSANRRKFLIFKITKDDYSYEVVTY